MNEAHRRKQEEGYSENNSYENNGYEKHFR